MLEPGGLLSVNDLAVITNNVTARERQRIVSDEFLTTSRNIIGALWTSSNPMLNQLADNIDIQAETQFVDRKALGLGGIDVTPDALDLLSQTSWRTEFPASLSAGKYENAQIEGTPSAVSATYKLPDTKFPLITVNLGERKAVESEEGNLKTKIELSTSSTCKFSNGVNAARRISFDVDFSQNTPIDWCDDRYLRIPRKLLEIHAYELGMTLADSEYLSIHASNLYGPVDGDDPGYHWNVNVTPEAADGEIAATISIDMRSKTVNVVHQRELALPDPSLVKFTLKYLPYIVDMKGEFSVFEYNHWADQGKQLRPFEPIRKVIFAVPPKSNPIG